MVWRLVVTDDGGTVMMAEYHETQAAAEERATQHRSSGRQAFVTAGTWADGTFKPS